MLARYSDEQLINKALCGNQRAWSCLVKRYETRILNHLLRIVGGHADACDLTQEVFMSTYKNLHMYRGDGVFASWLFRISANKVADYYRKKKWECISNGENFQDEISNENPEDTYLLTQSNKIIRDTLQGLPFDQRQVVELKIFQQFTFEEISIQTDTSIATVKTRFYAALKKLRNSKKVKNER